MLTILASFQSVMGTIGRVLLAFVILMFMVLVHETGHYTAGKLLKFKINEFSVGMGPKLLSKKRKNGEVVSLRLLPLGGYCAFEGEDGESPVEGAFNAQKPWKRLIVLVSGAAFNFISAVLICVILFGAYGETVAMVNTVYDYTPAINQQLQKGDIIYKINGKTVFMLDNLNRYMADEMDIVVLRDGKEVTIKGVTRNNYTSFNVANFSQKYVSVDDSKRELTKGDMIYRVNGNPVYEKGDLFKYLENYEGETCTITIFVGNEVNEELTGFLTKYYDYEVPVSAIYGENCDISVTEQEYSGIGMSINYLAYKFDFGRALTRVLPYCGEVAALVLRTLGGLFTGAVGLKDIGGPVTTISLTSEVVSYGFPSILALIVLISVNLAVFNLLPVPALDGCRMVFVIIEWIAGRPINRKVEGWINGIGLILLLGFVILVDVLKLF